MLNCWFFLFVSNKNFFTSRPINTDTFKFRSRFIARIKCIWNKCNIRISSKKESKTTVITSKRGLNSSLKNKIPETKCFYWRRSWWGRWKRKVIIPTKWLCCCLNIFRVYNTISHSYFTKTLIFCRSVRTTRSKVSRISQESGITNVQNSIISKSSEPIPVNDASFNSDNVSFDQNTLNGVSKSSEGKGIASDEPHSLDAILR